MTLPADAGPRSGPGGSLPRPTPVLRDDSSTTPPTLLPQRADANGATAQAGPSFAVGAGGPSGPDDASPTGERRRWWVAGAAVLAGAVAVWLTAGTVMGAPTRQTTGYVQPAQSRVLNFPVTAALTEVLVEPGDRVVAGQVLARLDGRSAQATLAAKRAVLTADEAMLALVSGDLPAEQVALLQSRVQAASSSSAAARDQLTTMSSAFQEAEAASAATVRQAEESLRSITELARERSAAAGCDADGCPGSGDADRADESCTEISWGGITISCPRPTDPSGGGSADDCDGGTTLCPYWEQQVAVAEARLTRAEDDYQRLRAGHRVDLSRANGALTRAGAELGVARASLLEGTAEASDAEIAALRAAISKGEAEVAQAEADLAARALVAPFDGLIGEVGGIDGELATPEGIRSYTAQASVTQPRGGIQLLPQAPQQEQPNDPAFRPLVVLYSATSEVVAQVPEADVEAVTIGGAAEASLPAVPGRRLSLRVERIDPSPVRDADGVSYLVRLSILPGQDTTGLMPGMTANVDL